VGRGSPRGPPRWFAGQVACSVLRRDGRDAPVRISSITSAAVVSTTTLAEMYCWVVVIERWPIRSQSRSMSTLCDRASHVACVCRRSWNTAGRVTPAWSNDGFHICRRNQSPGRWSVSSSRAWIPSEASCRGPDGVGAAGMSRGRGGTTRTGTHPSQPFVRLPGTTSLFEAAGFRRVVRTGSVSGGAVRWLVRLDLS